MNKRFLAAVLALLLLAAAVVVSAFFLRPAMPGAARVPFDIKEGEGFRSITARLAAAGVIRSRLAFEAYTLLTGGARQLKPGSYELSPGLSTPAIAGRLRRGIDREAVVTIPEGSNMYEIDVLLAEAGVLPKGGTISFADKNELEGYLFPDTYRFYLGSGTVAVQAKFAEAFARSIGPVLASSTPRALTARQVLVLASILEKEVQTEEDKRIVAGLLLKRMAEGVPLQVDASVCYGKRLARPDRNCHPVTTLDTQVESPYNTYLHKGLPPGPIGNPGISAVKAALSPIDSPYWYYLSDPVTNHTIFAKTLAEHEKNRAQYLLHSER